MAVANERLGRAMQRLSQDLYSKDVRFIMELLQNAVRGMACPAMS